MDRTVTRQGPPRPDPKPAVGRGNVLQRIPTPDSILAVAIQFHKMVEGEYGCPGESCPGVQRLVVALTKLVGIGRPEGERWARVLQFCSGPNECRFVACNVHRRHLDGDGEVAHFFRTEKDQIEVADSDESCDFCREGGYE